MKVSVIRSELVAALTAVSKALKPTSPLTIANSLCLTARENALEVKVENNISAVLVRIPADVFDEGRSIIYDPNKFINLIKKTNEGEILLSSDESVLKVKSGRKTATFPIVEVIYPNSFDIEEDLKIEVPCDLLLENLKIVSKFYQDKSDEFIINILNGIKFESNMDGLKLVALDGICLAKGEIVLASPACGEFVLPSEALKELVPILSTHKDEMVEILVDKLSVVFKFEDTLVFSRLLAGKYLNYKSVLPKNFSTDLTISKKELFKAVDCANLFATGKHSVIGIKVSTNLGELSIDSQEGSESFHSSLSCVGSGDEVKSHFSSKYLLDALKSIEVENVRLKFDDKYNLVILPEEGEDFMYFVLRVLVRK